MKAVTMPRLKLLMYHFIVCVRTSRTAEEEEEVEEVEEEEAEDSPTACLNRLSEDLEIVYEPVLWPDCLACAARKTWVSVRVDLVH